MLNISSNLYDKPIALQSCKYDYQLGYFKYYAEIEIDCCLLYNTPYFFNLELIKAKNNNMELLGANNLSFFILYNPRSNWNVAFKLYYYDYINYNMNECNIDGFSNNLKCERCILIDPILANGMSFNMDMDKRIFKTRIIIPYHITENYVDKHMHSFLYISNKDHLCYMELITNGLITIRSKKVKNRDGKAVSYRLIRIYEYMD